jgi:hypothetical protein
MTIIFKPNASLDIATDPCDLPEEGKENMVVSHWMKRCKNLRLDQTGVAKTRDGSTKLNATAIGQTAIYRIIEQGGVRYAFSGTVIYRNEVSIATGLTSAEWSAFLYNPYNSTTQSIFALNGTNRKRISGSTVYEWGVDSPTTVPTIIAGAKTGLTGAYNAKYTYCRKESSTVVYESNPSSAAAAAVTLTNGSLSVTWTASSDTQITHVRIYRTTAGGSIYYLDQDVAIGTVTVDTNTADESLNTEVAINHDRPPLGTIAAGPTYNGTCFILKDNLMYYCLPKQPEYWPTEYFIEVSNPQFALQSIVFYNSQPYCLSKRKIYYIQGTGHNTFFPFGVDSITGCVNRNAACAVHGQGIYHVGSDGIYLWSAKDHKVSQSRYEPIFRGETVNDVPGASSLANCWIFQFRDKLLFGYTSTGYTYPSNVLVFNLTNEKSYYYTWGREIRSLAADEYNGRLLAGDNSGYIWALEDKSVTTDDGTAVSWELESKDFTLQTRAHFPRWAKYDCDSSLATTATSEIMLDGVSHQSHTLTDTRNTKKRLIKTGNGQKCSVKISGTGPEKIYAVEME